MFERARALLGFSIVHISRGAGGSARANVPFDFVGLTVAQAKHFNLPENPEKPNQYQWESQR